MHPHNKRERNLIGRVKGLKRAKRYWNDFSWIQDREKAKELIQLNARWREDTTKLCSCSMCGNPRTHLGYETLQEIKDKEFVEEEMEELEERKS